MWEWIGYRPMADNDEVDAYVVTYIYEKIVDVFYKHNSEKNTNKGIVLSPLFYLYITKLKPCISVRYIGL